jgi:hypothetical protein
MHSPKYIHCWLPVNRDYARPGDGQWSNHEAYLDSCMVFARDPRLFVGVWVETSEEACYLYTGPLDAAADYEARLERLLAEAWFYHSHPPSILAGR